MKRWSWDVLGSVGNAPNRSRAAILEDAYSSLAFGERLYLVGRTASVQICKRDRLSANCRWKRGVTEAGVVLVS